MPKPWVRGAILEYIEANQDKIHSQKSLSKDLNISEPTIAKYIQELAGQNKIEIQRIGNMNIIKLVQGKLVKVDGTQTGIQY